jgi:hypothetical protein
LITIRSSPSALYPTTLNCPALSSAAVQTTAEEPVTKANSSAVAAINDFTPKALAR